MGLDTQPEVCHTVSHNMELYTKQLEEIEGIGGYFPNRTMRRNFVNPKRQQAGLDFLERIRGECGNKIGPTQEELDEEQVLLKLSSIAAVHKRPELSTEYIKSIGQNHWLSW